MFPSSLPSATHTIQSSLSHCLTFFHRPRVFDPSGQFICVEAGGCRLTHNSFVHLSQFRLHHQSTWIHPSLLPRSPRSVWLRVPLRWTSPTRRDITTAWVAPRKVGTAALVILPPRTRDRRTSTLGTVSQSHQVIVRCLARVHSLWGVTANIATGPRMAEKLLLDVQYECAKNNIDLPWDRIAQRLSESPFRLRFIFTILCGDCRVYRLLRARCSAMIPNAPNKC